MREIAADFISSNQGSIVLLTPISDDAFAWCDDNLAADAESFSGSIAVESRMFFDIAYALLEDGLTMQDAASGRMASLPVS